MKEKAKVITNKYIGDLFSVNQQEATKIIGRLERLVYANNESLVTIGEEADGLYFIEEGQVTVFDSSGEPVNEMGAGHYLGEYAILAGETRMTTVKAHGKVVAYRMSSKDFLDVVAKHPQITGRMLKQVYGQITDKHTKLVSLTRKNRGLMWAPPDERELNLKSILITYIPIAILFLITFMVASFISDAPVWWQILPVVFLVAFTLRTKRVLEGLMLTVILLSGMLNGGHFISGFKDMMIEGIGNKDTSETIVIMAMVESVAALLSAAGVVTVFRKFAKKYLKTRRESLFGMLLMLILVCIDECLNVVTAAYCFNENADKNKIPRESRAVLGSFSMAICSIIPFSLWSAYMAGWVAMYIPNGGNVFLKALLFNLAGILAFIFALLLCFGILPRTDSIKQAYKRVAEGGALWPEGSEQYFEAQDSGGVEGKMHNLLLPMLVWICSSVLFGILGENGNFGLDALSGLVVTLMFMFVLYVGGRTMTPKQYFEVMSEGIGNSLMPILLLVFAERIAAGLEEMGFVTLLEQWIPKIVGNHMSLIPMLLFVIFLAVCMVLGSCWGAFGIAIPITVYLSVRLGLNIPLCLGATLASGVVGEALCPFIDTTSPVVTAIGCEPHVYRKIRMQYWIPLTIICIAGYLILGLIFM